MKPNELHGEYDVVIVGAGPAGCTAARYLSDRFNVLLVDRSNFPRDKPCGGLLVKESQHFIKQLEPLDFIFSKPKELYLRLVDWDNSRDITLEREYLNVMRDKFDYWMLQLVGDGVEFLPNHEMIEFFQKKDQINVVVTKEHKTQVIKTKYLIGADGASSIIRKKLAHDTVRSYLTIQERVKADINTSALFIYDSEVTDFYSWVIPKGDTVIVGSALPLSNGDIRDRFDLLKKKLKEKLDIDGTYGNRESCLILRPKKIDDIWLGKKNIFLIGEAAGLISPSTGEGISFALRSGYYCAYAINKMREAQKDYQRLCKPLVDEISDKILKSEALGDVKSREEVLKNWELLSQPNAYDVAKELWEK